MSPAFTVCFDIFSPAPGDNDVTSQVFRESSNDRKIARRSMWIAIVASGRLAVMGMIGSRKVFWKTTSLCQSAGRYPVRPMGSTFTASRRGR